jgi:hypothetical protein
MAGEAGLGFNLDNSPSAFVGVSLGGSFFHAGAAVVAGMA